MKGGGGTGNREPRPPTDGRLCACDSFVRCTVVRRIFWGRRPRVLYLGCDGISIAILVFGAAMVVSAVVFYSL